MSDAMGSVALGGASLGSDKTGGESEDDTIEDQDGNPVQFVPKQVSLFPVIPSATWNFKF